MTRNYFYLLLVFSLLALLSCQDTNSEYLPHIGQREIAIQTTPVKDTPLEISTYEEIQLSGIITWVDSFPQGYIIGLKEGNHTQYVATIDSLKLKGITLSSDQFQVGNFVEVSGPIWEDATHKKHIIVEAISWVDTLGR